MKKFLHSRKSVALMIVVVMIPAGLFLLIPDRSAPPTEKDAKAYPNELYRQKVRQRILHLLRQWPGIAGLYAKDISADFVIEYNADVVFAAASVIKLAVLYSVVRSYAMKPDIWNRRITITANDIVGGSGTLQTALRRGPIEKSLAECIRLMITESDNIATNVVIRFLGIHSINADMDRLGFHTIRLHRFMLDPKAGEKENTMSPREAAGLLYSLFWGPGISSKGRTLIRRYLSNVHGLLRETAPDYIRIFSKTGRLSGIENEAAVIDAGGKYYLFLLFSTYNDRLAEQRRGRDLIRQIGREYLSYIRNTYKSNRYGRRIWGQTR